MRFLERRFSLFGWIHRGRVKSSEKRCAWELRPGDVEGQRQGQKTKGDTDQVSMLWALDLRAFRVCLYLNITVRRFGGRRMWSRVEVARKQIRRPGGGAKKGVEMA